MGASTFPDLDLEAGSGRVIEAAMQAHQRGLSRGVYWPVYQVNEVDVADRGLVVSRRERPGNEQGLDPTELLLLLAQLGHCRRGRWGHGRRSPTSEVGTGEVWTEASCSHAPTT